jgi:hypothetical protein
VFRYRLHSPDGDDLGEATYAQMIKPGEEILLRAGQRFRVLDVVPFEEEDESPFVGQLQVERPDASRAGCCSPLPKVRRVRGSESPRTRRAVLPQTRSASPDSPLAP